LKETTKTPKGTRLTSKKIRLNLSTLPLDAKLDLLGPGQRKLYRLVAVAGPRGKTCEELTRAASMTHQTVGPRLLELRKSGLLLHSGATRPTATGKAAQVHVSFEVAKGD
jgi:hypothetical protein